MWFPLIVVIAQLSAAPAPVQKAYQKLTQTDLDADVVAAAGEREEDRRDREGQIGQPRAQDLPARLR